MIVRGFVRSLEKARKVLQCQKCDETEGIYIGNVSDVAALTHAAAGAQAVAIAVGVGGKSSTEEMKAVEFTGVENTVAALATSTNVAKAPGGVAGLRVVLCSSMGTTDPNPKPMEGGSVLFWKLNAEAMLASSGVPFVIVKPGGLLSLPGNHSTLLVGRDDALFDVSPPVVSRADVARVMGAALAYPGAPSIRFDLVSKLGPPQQNLQALLFEAEYPWERASGTAQDKSRARA